MTPSPDRAADPDQSDPERLAEWERVRLAVGRRIREIRTRTGLTQETLALRSGFSRNLLVDVELGKSGLLYERLFDLAAALDIPAHELLKIENTAVGEASRPPTG
ncbi:transcriptional regulator with XRE-family HTH domain [Mycobacterium sp. OTB74]|nr:transcriptional regulator with XRE-family HTH domain [Mycobacterium sp. OTB74]